MKRKFVLIWLVLAFALTCRVAFAAGAAKEIRLNQVQQNKDTLTMHVSLVDEAGNPIQGNFSADEFTVQIDDSIFPAESVTALDPNTTGINYMLCIDVSKSLTQEMMANMHAAIFAFVDGLGPKDTVSLLTFGSSVKELTRMNSNPDQIKSLVNAIDRTDNNTALYKGVLDAVAIASKINGRTTVIVITDGENDVATADDSVKDYTKENIYESVTAAQVPLYCVGLTEGKSLDRDSLRELASATGGDQFFGPSWQVSSSLNKIQRIMRSAYMLSVKPVNYGGRTGFEELTSFVVGYEPSDAPFVSSNKLDQEINWSSIPAPVYTPAPTAVPEISLDLDNAEIVYRDGGNVTISGVIDLREGGVPQDALSIIVNGERWHMELNPNGTNYIFTASGTISESTTALDVSVSIQGTGISSRHYSLEVATPTPAATSTPKPTLSLTLDATDQSLIFEVGKVITLTGVVEAKSSPINVGDLVLLVNDVPCEIGDVQFNDIGGNQYEFTANYTIAPGSPTTLDVSVQVSGSDIASRKQRVYIPTPAPTAEPKLTLLLDETHIFFEPGGEVTFSGTIEAEGAVDMNDIGVYVEGALWNNTIIDRLDDGSFHFETSGYLAGALSSANVRASLISAQSIRSAQEKLDLWSPTPVITPTPTPKPVQTPPPTPIPTATPTPEPTPTATPDNSVGGMVSGGVRTLRESGRLWMLIVAIILLLLLLGALGVMIFLLMKKNKAQPSGNFNRNERRGNPNSTSTVRSDMRESNPVSAGTVQSSANYGNEPFRGDERDAYRRDSGQAIDGTVKSASSYEEEPYRGSRRDAYRRDSIHSSSSTINMDRDVDSSGTIMNLGDDMGSARMYDAPNAPRYVDQPTSGSTQRVTYDDEEVSSGTQRISDDEYEAEPILLIRMEESYKGERREERSFEMARGEKRVIGRRNSADIFVNDSAISSQHCELYFGGEELFVEDLNSTNGTKINGEHDKLEPAEMRKLQDGDELHIGKTVLTLHFGEARLG